MIRCLILAEAANPEWVSVPLVGWSLASALKLQFDCHVVTHIRNRDALERAGWQEGQDFTAIDNEWLAGPLYRLSDRLRGGSGRGWTTVMAFSALSYYAFEYAVWKHFKNRIIAKEFDIVHRITPLSPTVPSIIGRKLKNRKIPFIVGPYNGGLSWPKGTKSRRKAEKEWLSYLRPLYKLLPGYRSTLKHASAIIVGSGATSDRLPNWCRDKTIRMPENGIDRHRFQVIRTKKAVCPLRIIFVGRLVPYKCADILIKAATGFLKNHQIEILIVGDGPQRQALESLCAQLGVSDRINFKGWLEHSRIAELLAASDLLVLPSIREFGGGVVLEAMAVGLVPVVANYGGPAELVTSDTGFKIPFKDLAGLEDNLRLMLGRLLKNPQHLDAMGMNARKRIDELFTWEKKAHQIGDVYRWILGRADRPDFGFHEDV